MGDGGFFCHKVLIAAPSLPMVLFGLCLEVKRIAFDILAVTRLSERIKI